MGVMEDERGGLPACEVCGQPLTVGGDDRTDGGTQYYWCRQCKAPKDPVGAVRIKMAPLGRPILRLRSPGMNKVGIAGTRALKKG